MPAILLMNAVGHMGDQMVGCGLQQRPVVEKQSIHPAIRMIPSLLSIIPSFLFPFCIHLDSRNLGSQSKTAVLCHSRVHSLQKG